VSSVEIEAVPSTTHWVDQPLRRTMLNKGGCAAHALTSSRDCSIHLRPTIGSLR